ncbi:hypothetical protein BDV12DRAFT_176034 [Aspergillus spectabilis]
MVCLLVGLSLRRLPSRMPLAGSCSLAISAACHPPKGEDLTTVALGPVMWGETTHAARDGQDGGYTQLQDNGQSHPQCSFTAMDVETPSPMKWYA